MANDLVLAGGKFQRPGHLAVFESEPSNLKVMSVRVPTISMQGKVFAIQADGKEMRLTKTIEGDEVPIPSVPVVILGFNANRGRSYYEGTFDAKNIKPPVCWSSDNVTPDEAVPDKQSPKCATCKWSVKGSRISDNQKQVSACSEYRLVALIPYKALHTDMPPLRLRLPPTSDYDGQNKDAKARDLYAFSQFIDFIRSRGVQHSYEMIVKMSFDTTPGITYPKLWFQAQGWVTAEDAARIADIRAEGGVDLCLGTDEGAVAAQSAEAQAEATPVTGTVRTTTAGRKATTPKPPAETKPAETKPPVETAAQKAKAAAQAAIAEAERLEAEEAAGKAQVGAVAMNLGDDDDDRQTGAATASATGNGTVDAKEPPAATHVDDKDVDDIMQQWSGE